MACLILATQATREVTTTTKEIQPEKRAQAVQTYTEPPFLQKSEGVYSYIHCILICSYYFITLCMRIQKVG